MDLRPLAIVLVLAGERALLESAQNFRHAFRRMSKHGLQWNAWNMKNMLSAKEYQIYLVTRLSTTFVCALRFPTIISKSHLSATRS